MFCQLMKILHNLPPDTKFSNIPSKCVPVALCLKVVKLLNHDEKAIQQAQNIRGIIRRKII